MTSASRAIRSLQRPSGRAGSLLRLLDREHPAIALLVYAGAAVVWQFHAVVHFQGSCACVGNDPTLFMWSMAWWPHALLSGLNPFVTHAIWAPDAINLAANTSVPGPALLGWPLTAVAGPVASYNLLMLVAPITGAWFAYRLCLYVTRSPAASILAGYLYGFSTYGFGELEGHMHLVFTFAAPAAALLALRRLDGAISVRRYVVLTALVLIAQLSCGTEMAFTGTVMGAVALLAGWIFSAPPTRARIVALLPPLTGAYAAAAVISSPLLYYALTGPQVALDRGLAFPADALSFFIPTEIMRVGGHRFAGVSSAFEAGYVETGTYLGLPMIVIVAAFIIQRWRARVAKIMLAILTVAVVWSLGAVLNIDGHPTIPLPWKLFARVRDLNEILPARIGVYIVLVCAMVVALWLTAPGSSALRRWPLALLAVVLLIPNTAFFNQRLDEPTFFTTNLYRRYLTRGEVVLPIPYGATGTGLLWQASTSMYFRMASGNFYLPPDFGGDPFVQQALGPAAPPPTAAAAAVLRSFVAARRVQAILVDAADPQGWPAVIALLRYPVVQAGGVLVYQVTHT